MEIEPRLNLGTHDTYSTQAKASDSELAWEANACLGSVWRRFID